MEFLGIGWQELFFIFVIALIVLGPRDMQRAGQSLGRWLNRLVNSDGWKVFQQTSSELRKLPRTLMREANLEEAERELRRTLDPRFITSPERPPQPELTPPPSKEEPDVPEDHA